MMKLKYSEELAAFPDCPPADAAVCASDKDVFRFVHKDIEDKRNFLPVAKLSPNRQFDEPDKKCDALSLSIFDSKESATKFLLRLMRTNKLIGKRIGDHLASLRLTKRDGLLTKPRSDGHLSFHEAETFVSKGRFTMIGEIK